MNETGVDQEIGASQSERKSDFDRSVVDILPQRKGDLLETPDIQISEDINWNEVNSDYIPRLKQLGDRYAIKSYLGEGFTGTVYGGLSRDKNERVIIKLEKSQISDKTREAFREESLQLALLSNQQEQLKDGILATPRLVEKGEGCLIETEVFQGISADDYVEGSAREGKGTLNLKFTLQFLDQALRIGECLAKDDHTYADMQLKNFRIKKNGNLTLNVIDWNHVGRLNRELKETDKETDKERQQENVAAITDLRRLTSYGGRLSSGEAVNEEAQKTLFLENKYEMQNMPNVLRVLFERALLPDQEWRFNTPSEYRDAVRRTLQLSEMPLNKLINEYDSTLEKIDKSDVGTTEQVNLRFDLKLQNALLKDVKPHLSDEKAKEDVRNRLERAETRALFYGGDFGIELGMNAVGKGDLEGATAWFKKVKERTGGIVADRALWLTEKVKDKNPKIDVYQVFKIIRGMDLGVYPSTENELMNRLKAKNISMDDIKEMGLSPLVEEMKVREVWSSIEDSDKNEENVNSVNERISNLPYGESLSDELGVGASIGRLKEEKIKEKGGEMVQKTWSWIESMVTEQNVQNLWELVIRSDVNLSDTLKAKLDTLIKTNGWQIGEEEGRLDSFFNEQEKKRKEDLEKFGTSRRYFQVREFMGAKEMFNASNDRSDAAKIYESMINFYEQQNNADRSENIKIEDLNSLEDNWAGYHPIDVLVGAQKLVDADPELYRDAFTEGGLLYPIIEKSKEDIKKALIYNGKGS